MSVCVCVAVRECVGCTLVAARHDAWLGLCFCFPLRPANHPENRNKDEAIQQRQRVVLQLANPLRTVVV